MPILNSIAENQPKLTAWRHFLHMHPELDLRCHKTSDFVADRLKEMGVDQIERGWAKTGLIAVIEGRQEGPMIALRADMDALPIVEATGVTHASTVDGVMHACGHDGHTTMLLGAAEYLAETRNFKGTVALIFQPAEETIGGAGIMVEEGLFDRYPIEEVYALHILPNAPVGHFATRPGPIMAAVSDLEITVTGRGGHAAHPDQTVDPLAVAVAIHNGLQVIISRNLDPIETGLISVTNMSTSSPATNVIADQCSIGGTARAFEPKVQGMIMARIAEVAEHTAAAHGASVEITWTDGYPAVVNDPDCTEFAAGVAGDLVGAENVTLEHPPSLGAEDFSFFLNHKPGAYLMIGNGPSAGLHHPAFDFNDDALGWGASYFAQLVEQRLRPD